MSQPKMTIQPSELVPLTKLTPHPRNYQQHPKKQVEHIAARIREFGFYRNIVVARDYTILAGHGSVKGAALLGMTEVPVVKLDLDPEDPRAIKVLEGDNEVARMAVVDEEALKELLRELATDGDALMGSGFTPAELERMLAPPLDPDAEWEGMPEFDQQNKAAFRQILVSFRSHEDAEAFGKLIGQSITDRTRALWYPAAPIGWAADKAYKVASG